MAAEAIILHHMPVGLFKREQQLHSSFRRLVGPTADVVMCDASPQSNGSTDQQQGTGSHAVRMKRHRWEQQLGVAMGDTLGSEGCCTTSMVDLAHLVPLDTSTPQLVQSVDGSVLAHEAAPAVDDVAGKAPRVIMDYCTHGWVYASPISGEMWIRML